MVESTQANFVPCRRGRPPVGPGGVEAEKVRFSAQAQEDPSLLSGPRHPRLDRIIAGIKGEGWTGLPRSALAQERTNLRGLLPD